ncbi:hypothetical protein [Cryptosporangium aurantiacum]|uniref:Uncharacterized protein n=1 Tax=Cryptosporangium aurantiacum TaxID=134849 RepID=A0A1M7TXA9_9ACTN|nr:hypothetical protein [Cryptosporangium aurantiacum]SHN75361.1 hypothetical protein SAMN05443668_107279 [Cryptosporangium aurantiacum]
MSLPAPLTARVEGTGANLEAQMNGWLMWGLILPVLLVVAGVIAIRRRNGR